MFAEDELTELKDEAALPFATITAVEIPAAEKEDRNKALPGFSAVEVPAAENDDANL